MKKSVTIEYIKAILLAFALALFIRIFVVQAFRIPSGSMENTLLVGDFLLANKFIYGARIPLPTFTCLRGVRLLPAILSFFNIPEIHPVTLSNAL